MIKKIGKGIGVVAYSLTKSATDTFAGGMGAAIGAGLVFGTVCLGFSVKDNYILREENKKLKDELQRRIWKTEEEEQ